MRMARRSGPHRRLFQSVSKDISISTKNGILTPNIFRFRIAPKKPAAGSMSVVGLPIWPVGPASRWGVSGSVPVGDENFEAPLRVASEAQPVRVRRAPSRRPWSHE